MVSQSAVVCLAFLAAVSATDVNPCKGKLAKDNGKEVLSKTVELNPCNKLPCKLKKGTNQGISIEFTAETDIEDVKNHVTAEVFNLPVPFIGVDGTSICDKIFTKSGDKASCPLKAGTTYQYKDTFPILDFYPSLKTNVHWSLQHGQDRNKKDITCFEVPVKIVN